MYRLNTFALIHMGFWHMLVDTICLVPLLERFEAEWGTLTTLALFLGRKCCVEGSEEIERADRDYSFGPDTSCLVSSV